MESTALERLPPPVSVWDWANTCSRSLHGSDNGRVRTWVRPAGGASSSLEEPREADAARPSLACATTHAVRLPLASSTLQQHAGYCSYRTTRGVRSWSPRGPRGTVVVHLHTRHTLVLHSRSHSEATVCRRGATADVTRGHAWTDHAARASDTR